MSNKTRGENHNQLNPKTSTETKTNQLNSILNIDQGETRTIDRIFDIRIEREWLSTTEAAQFLSISENALRIMVHREQIPAFKFGRRLRFKVSDCRALFQPKGA